MRAASEQQNSFSDYFVILSPDESYQTIYLVMDAPSARDAEKAVWAERWYNSGEPVKIRPTSDREAAIKAAKYVVIYAAAVQS